MGLESLRERERERERERAESDNLICNLICDVLSFEIKKQICSQVTTVLNADVPESVRDYVHRVGRCARGGASGTALGAPGVVKLGVLEADLKGASSSKPWGSQP